MKALAFIVLAFATSHFAFAVGEINGSNPNTAPNSGGNQNSKVWEVLFKNKFSSPLTADDSKLSQFGQPNAPFQSPARLRIGGRDADGGLQHLGAEKSLPNVCSGDAAQKLSLCKDKKDEVIKAWDAAGLVFGVPSAAMMCIEAESIKTHKDAGAAPPKDANAPKAPQALTDEQMKANKPNFKMAREKFMKMTGQGGGDQQAAPASGGGEPPEKPMSAVSSAAYESAYNMRILLLELEPTILQKSPDFSNEDYFELIKVMAIAKAGTGEEARQAAAGGLRPVKVPQNYQSFIDGVMKCLGQNAQIVGAPADHSKGVKKQ